MNNGWILTLGGFSLIIPASASSSGDPALGFATQLTLQDYFLIFIGGILLFNLSMILWRTVFRPAPQKEHSRIVTAVGSFMAIFFIGMGSLATCIALITFLGAALQIVLFHWIAVLLIYYTGSLTVGILVLCIIGVGLFLLGAYNLFLLQNSPFWKSLEPPHRQGTVEKKDIGNEDWNPPLFKLKVLDKTNNMPAANKRVILKDATGKKYFTRYTNTEGEVIFESIKGHLADYYAYVDGDENRQTYHLIRVNA